MGSWHPYRRLQASGKWNGGYEYFLHSPSLSLPPSLSLLCLSVSPSLFSITASVYVFLWLKRMKKIYWRFSALFSLITNTTLLQADKLNYTHRSPHSCQIAHVPFCPHSHYQIPDKSGLTGFWSLYDLHLLRSIFSCWFIATDSL